MNKIKYKLFIKTDKFFNLLIENEIEICNGEFLKNLAEEFLLPYENVAFNVAGIERKRVKSYQSFFNNYNVPNKIEYSKAKDKITIIAWPISLEIAFPTLYVFLKEENPDVRRSLYIPTEKGPCPIEVVRKFCLGDELEESDINKAVKYFDEYLLREFYPFEDGGILLYAKDLSEEEIINRIRKVMTLYNFSLDIIKK